MPEIVEPCEESKVEQRTGLPPRAVFSSTEIVSANKFENGIRADRFRIQGMRVCQGVINWRFLARCGKFSQSLQFLRLLGGTSVRITLRESLDTLTADRSCPSGAL